MEILDQLEAFDLETLDAADLYILAYRLNKSAQRAAAVMLERSGQQKLAGSSRLEECGR